MDPNACLRELLEALVDLRKRDNIHDRESVILRLESLADWLREEGFAPHLVQHANSLTFSLDHAED